LQRLLKRLERWGVRLFCTDDWAPYDTALPAGRHYIGKDQTQRSESYNCSSERTSRYVVDAKRLCCAGSGTVGCLARLAAC
jgi:IS1 family transposase